MKIFCIGLPRTGTTTICSAFEMLGFSAKHIYETLEISDYEKYDAYADTPIWVPEFFKKLYNKYPDAKFIYTYRDIEKWMASIINFKWFAMPNVFNNMATKLAYEAVFSYPFNKDNWIIDFHKHKDKVDSFFKDKPLLRIDITDAATGEEKWKKICEFLGVEIPKEEFPNKNTHKMTMILKQP